MNDWQKNRLERAKEQDIFVCEVDCQPDSFRFVVQGISDEYQVQIYRQIELWPPSCTCDDHFWRGNLCKHIILCSKLMGVSDQDLVDLAWEPEQDELYDYLMNANGCVGNCLQADQCRR